MAEWIKNLANKFELSNSHANSIYRVPKFIIDATKSKAYKPRLASFGPYHHGRHYLYPMEQHKVRALFRYLDRIANASKTPEDVIIAMTEVESRLLASYDSLDTDEGDDLERGQHREWLKEKNEFVKLMIVDGCFALEFMLACKSSVGCEQNSYDMQDPIFGDQGKRYLAPDLRRDMLLLENQIPFLALSTLASIDGSGIGDVAELIRGFYDLPSASPDDPTLADQYFHILDLYKKLMKVKGNYFPSHEKNKRSATELRNVGVTFCKSNSKSFKDISFNKGVLSLPQLEIDDTTESLLLNLMAFERMHVTAGNEVTAYAVFMDGLIDNANDVALLRNKDIILGWVGNDDDIANMFNKITQEMTLITYSDKMHPNVDTKLNIYYKKRVNRWRVSFVNMYHKNPLVFIFLLGGLFFLSLVAVQTICKILKYYDQ